MIHRHLSSWKQSCYVEMLEMRVVGKADQGDNTPHDTSLVHAIMMRASLLGLCETARDAHAFLGGLNEPKTCRHKLF